LDGIVEVVDLEPEREGAAAAVIGRACGLKASGGSQSPGLLNRRPTWARHGGLEYRVLRWYVGRGGRRNVSCRCVRYLALLRGINVGGKTLIKMADLKTCVEALVLDNVSTYIASGNVLFESGAADAAKLEKKIEHAIRQQFQLPIKVIVLDRPAYARIVKAIPQAWIGDASLRANVAFVRRGTDARQVVRELQPDPAIEEVKALDGAILWATNRDALNRSMMRKLIGSAAYKELTVRSLSTTLKLQELLAQ
jgi:uncharacterized protein (DUF1697 family)